jgi:acyl-CoA thioester hydrolase
MVPAALTVPPRRGFHKDCPRIAMTIPAPFVWDDLKVVPAWVDENGHMNVAFYLKCFDDAFYGVYRAWGMDFADVHERGFTTFAGQSNLTYLGELFLDDAFSIETMLVEHDRKRIRWFMQMRKADGSLAATCEWLLLFVDIHQRKVTAMPDDLFEALSAIQQAHAALPRPPQLGRAIALGNKKPA